MRMNELIGKLTKPVRVVEARCWNVLISFAANRARSISEGKAATKKVWEDERCSKHYGYRPGKSESKRPSR